MCFVWETQIGMD